MSLLFFLPKAAIKRGIFFQNKKNDIPLIILAILFISLNGFIFAFSIDSLYYNSKFSFEIFQIFLKVIYLFFAIPIIISGIFPVFKPINLLNKKIYPISSLKLFIIDVVRGLLSFLNILLILFCVVLTIFSQYFSISDAINILIFFYICFHINRALRTILSYEFNFIAFLYLMTGFIFVVIIVISNLENSIYNFAFASIITVLSYFSFLKFSDKIAVEKKSKELFSFNNKFFNVSILRMFFRDSKITSTIAMFLFAKMSFIFIFSTNISNFILGSKYFLMLGILPVFLYNYLFNNIFAYTNKAYLNYFISPIYKNIIFKSYGLFTLIIASIDLLLALICLKTIEIAKIKIDGLFISSDSSNLKIVILYISFLVFWYPISLYFSYYYPKNVGRSLFSNSHSNVWAGIATGFVGVLFTIISLYVNDYMFLYIFSSIIIVLGVISMIKMYNYMEQRNPLILQKIL